MNETKLKTPKNFPDQSFDLKLPQFYKTIAAFFSQKNNLILSSAVLMAVIFGATALYFWNEVKKDPQRAAQEEIEDTLARVSRLMVLPEGETPTVATVTDPERLKDQPFFVNAKAGYKVLIYTNARKAILYDPVADKIVEVAPLNLGEPAK